MMKLSQLFFSAILFKSTLKCYQVGATATTDIGEIITGKQEVKKINGQVSKNLFIMLMFLLFTVIIVINLWIIKLNFLSLLTSFS